MPLIVVLLGAPFALQRGRQATLGVGVALSLAVFVVYLLLQAVGMALGTAGLLPLPLAAWAANLLLLLLGAWLFLRTEE
jgi:lipopolysaccharide export system permease protein